MDPILALAGGGAVGTIAAYIAVHYQNLLGGIVALAAGATLLIVVAGATTPSGMFGGLETLLGEGGVLALVGLVVGGAAGAWAAINERHER